MSRTIGVQDILNNLGKTETKMVKTVVDIVNVNCLLLQTHIRKDLMINWQGGSKSDLLQSRTGQFKRNIQKAPTKILDNKVISGIDFGTVYAKTHVGPKGQVTTIKPKNVKFLTIPLPAAQGPHGQTRGRARETSIYGETFVKRSKAGNLLIFGKLKYVKGAHAGETKGKLVPLFLLVKESKIPTRIHPEDLIRWVKPKIESDLKNAMH